jgi:hypothetical protein
LASVLDGLAGVDVSGLSADEQLAFVATLAAGINRLQATLHGAVRAADRSQAHALDGAVSMKAWLRGSCRLSPAEAAAIVSTGRRLEQLPATMEAFAAREISAAHARVITRAVTQLGWPRPNRPGSSWPRPTGSWPIWPRPRRPR